MELERVPINDWFILLTAVDQLTHVVRQIPAEGASEIEGRLIVAGETVEVIVSRIRAAATVPADNRGAFT